MKRLWLNIGFLIAVATVAVAYGAMENPKGKSEVEIAPETFTVTSAQRATLEITYIANEGVLLSSGDTQVLIDGLHREYKPSYAFLGDEEQRTIEQAEAPFDRIDLILVSHVHRDHFHPESVGLHMRHNPEARLLSSQQVVAELEEHFEDYEAIRARVTAATPHCEERFR